MSHDAIAQAISTLGVEPTAEIVTKVRCLLDQGCLLFSHAVSQALFAA